MKVQVDELKRVTLQVLARSGYPPDECETILNVIMYAQLRGNNQGIVKLIGAGMPRDKACKPITTQRDTKLSALLDGGRNSGMVVVTYAMKLAIQKAGEHGIGIVGTNNTNSSTGAIGYYASQIAQAGYIGLVFSGSGEYMAMHGSYQPIFGTNPLAFGIPTTGKPIVFDMATASIARFGIVEAKTAGRSIPEGVAYDNKGEITTDPAAALGGAIRAFGGYKGAALALLVEVLTHPLVSTTPDGKGHKSDWGNLLLVIDPELLVDGDTFAERTSSLVQRLKDAQKLPGVDEILVPGERGDRFMDSVMQAGSIEIEDQLWAALQQAAN
ncbi:MAG: Ldh family oxidoreductase [Chloroflexota bacterium]